MQTGAARAATIPKDDPSAGVTIHYVTTIDEVLGIAMPAGPHEERKDAEERERVLTNVQ